MWKFLKLKKNTHLIGIIVTLLVIAAIPLTVFLNQQQQNTKQEAATEIQCNIDAPTDMMILFDKSSSMTKETSSTDTTPRIDSAKVGATQFVDLLASHAITPKHLIGLVSISSGGFEKLEHQLTTSYSTLKTAINAMTAQGGTCIECSLKIAHDEVRARQRDNIKNVSVVFTDGGAMQFIGYNEATSTLTPAQVKAEARKRAIAEAVKGHNELDMQYYFIGFGTDAQQDFLKDIAAQTEGKYIYAPTAVELKAAFEEIASEVGKTTINGEKYYDEDKDGVKDTEESRLEGWDILLKNSSGSEIGKATTDADGKYSFTNVCPGTYTLEENLKSGWQKVTPGDKYTVTATNTTTTLQRDFGNIQVLPTNTPTPTPIPVCPENATLDAVIVFDKSASMQDPTSSTDPTPRMIRAKSAAVSFVDILANDTKSLEPHHAGLVSFGPENQTLLDSQLTEDYPLVKGAIDAMEIVRETCVECGVKIANAEFARGARVKAKKIAILITDGTATRYAGAEPPFNQETHNVARKRALDEIKKGYAEQKISYYTIGFGNDVDKAFLQEAATSSGGKYIQVPSATQLQSAFKEIADIAGVSKITGVKFNDENNNAKLETEEERLNDWTIEMRDNDGQIVNTKVTDENGEYSFDPVCNGTYTVSEVQKDGWVKTLPKTDAYTLIIKNGLPATNTNFGNKLAPTEMTFNMSLLLDGLGRAGDIQNTEESEFSNKDPRNTTRDVTLDIISSIGTITKASGTVDYQKDQGLFTGIVKAITDLTSGQYDMRIKTPGYLSKKLANKIQITRGQENTIPASALVAGDTNNDNTLNMLDYNNILSCYTGLKGIPATCSETLHPKSDINNDGAVNEFDYNLFIRELPARAGT